MRSITENLFPETKLSNKILQRRIFEIVIMRVCIVQTPQGLESPCFFVSQVLETDPGTAGRLTKFQIGHKPELLLRSKSTWTRAVIGGVHDMLSPVGEGKVFRT